MYRFDKMRVTKSSGAEKEIGGIDAGADANRDTVTATGAGD